MQCPRLAVKVNWNRADAIRKVNEAVEELRQLTPTGAGVVVRTIWILALNSLVFCSTLAKKDKTFIHVFISTTVTSAVP